ncbi:MAG TPA: hypothetical protein VMT03_17400 [Polyangia bacterium]|nr:hypothetical protein [Polyangia bacterium]
MSSQTLLGLTIDRAKRTASDIARFLIEVEDFLEAEKISAEHIVDWNELIRGIRGRRDTVRKKSVDRFEERLARIVIRTWTEEVTSRGRRPDVLSLACELLSNPELPFTRDSTRFCIVLALRAYYVVDYSTSTLQELRKAYDDLRRRWSGQKLRQRKGDLRHENLILDILCMDGKVIRSLTGSNLRSYYQGFQEYPFGIARGHRTFSEEQDWPQLRGELSDFSALLNALFTQPTSVPGLDEVTGGLLAAVPDPQKPNRSRGLVTLLTGPAGSGKTSLSLAIASRMAEMGSRVRYIATEESIHSLSAKVRTSVESMTGRTWPALLSDKDILDRDFDFADGNAFATLEELRDALTSELSLSIPEAPPEPGEVRFYLPFPAVVVIDSLTALLHGGDRRSTEKRSASDASRDSGLAEQRRSLATVLNDLRECGVCVLLVGGQADRNELGLEYLVDNVFSLELEPEPSGRHPVRVFSVDKTRLQTSHRGRHVLHLSGQNGVSISPSLHSVLRDIRGGVPVESDENRRAILWTEVRPKQMSLPGLRERVPPVTIRAHAQTLVYGYGSAGKARFGMAAMFEPRRRREPSDQWWQYVEGHAEHADIKADRQDLSRTRVLVVSFLYPREYYERISASLFAKRFDYKAFEAKGMVDQCLSVLDFYPGYVDPETLVAKVRNRIRSARLDGRPFTGIVIDGVHNLIIEFPLLEREPLLWPTLYRLFRIEGIEALSTFTLFRVPDMMIDGDREADPIERRLRREVRREEAAMVPPVFGAAGQLFFHMLVSSCDHSFRVERPTNAAIVRDARVGRNWVRVRVATSVDGFGREPAEFWWDPDQMTYRPEQPRRPTLGSGNRHEA